MKKALVVGLLLAAALAACRTTGSLGTTKADAAPHPASLTV